MSASTQAVKQAVEASAEHAENRKRLFGAILGAGLAVLLRLLPTPHGLTSVGHSILAILAMTVVYWVFEVLGNAPTAVLMLGLMILAGVKPAVALSSFSALPFWILVVVLFYGYAMQSTGLAKRLSFVILNLFPATYGGILGSFFLIGLILSLGVPSMTVRTAIMTPIAWALVQALGLEPKGRGCSLIMVSCVEMAVIPGCATLLGSLWGPLMIGLFSKRGMELQWIPWARAMFLPTVVWSVLLLVGNYFALRPDQEITVGKAFARAELSKLGPMSLKEKATSVIVILSIVYWVLGSLHKQPTFVVGMLAMAAFVAFGILREKDFGGAVNWSLLLFLGAVFALPEIIEQNKVTEWVAEFIVPTIAKVSGHVLVFCLLLALVMFLLRLTDPTGFLIMTVLFLPISSILKDAPISPIVIIASILIAGHPFWALYQNFWIAMMHGMTNNMSSTSFARVRLANVYFIASLVALTIAVGYWRLIGLWQ
jgi:anion transporter